MIVKQLNTQLHPREAHNELLIFITLYTRIRWYPYGLNRSSQHVLTSSSTLQNIWDCVSCMFKGHGKMPKEIIEAGLQEEMGGNEPKYKVVGYQSASEEEDHDSVVMAINDNVYCDAYGTPDYAEYVAVHLFLLSVYQESFIF